MLATLHTVVVAGLKWNPTVRGILFPGLMFVILCGSSYLLLATNVGNRLGFLIAAAGLAGWIMLMSVMWMIYGIGLRGRAPAWHVEERLTGSTASAQFQPATNLKQGWKVLPEGNATRGDAQAAADAYLVTSEETKVFAKIDEYVTVTAVERGGGRYPSFYTPKEKQKNLFKKFFAAAGRKTAIFHSPHHLVIEVAPVVKEEIKDTFGNTSTRVKKGDDNKPVIDTKKPVTTLVMVRDLGTQRQPPFMVFLSSGILFAVITRVLHTRDKGVMAAMKGARVPARA